MAGGCIDIQLGKRGDFDRCEYWKRKESDEDLSEYVHNHKPSGTFYAQEVSAYYGKKSQVGNLFLFDESTITLRTKSKIEIKQGDIIRMNDDIWIVKDWQFVPLHKNNQFMKSPSGFTYIQIQK